MKETLGQLLRAIRHQRRETLEEVSQATGISIAMLSRVERDQRSPSPSVIAELAEYYSIPDEVLMGRAAAQNLATKSDPRSRRWASRWLSDTPPDIEAEDFVSEMGYQPPSAPRPEASMPAPESRHSVASPTAYEFREQPIEALFDGGNTSLQDSVHVAEVALERAVREARRAIASGNPEREAEGRAVLERLVRIPLDGLDEPED